MLLPERMARISILVSKRDLDIAVQALLDTGSFQPLSKMGEGGNAERARILIPSVNEAINRLEQYMQLSGYSGDMASKYLSGSVIEGEGWFEIVDRLMERAREIGERFEDLYRRARELQDTISRLEPLEIIINAIKDLDVDLGMIIDRGILKAYLITAPKERISRIIKAIEKKGVSYQVIERDIDQENSVLIIITRRIDDDMREILKIERAREIEIPKGYPTIPKMLAEQISMELSNARKELESLREKARGIFQEISREFITTYKALKTAREALQLISRTRDKGRYSVIEGYIPKSRLEPSLDLLKKLGENVTIEVKEIGRLERNLDEEPPSKYSVPRRLEVFKTVSELYGPPSYREVIPIYLTAITFPLIFGLMFPDLGHGIVLLIAGLVFYRVLGRTSKGYRELGEIVIYISIAAIIAGLLSGEFFGPATPVAKALEHWYEETFHIKPPLAIPIGGEASQDAARDALMLLIFISLRIGGATLSVSALLGLANSLIERDFEKMLVRDMPRLLLFLSVTMPMFAYQDIESVGATYYYMAFLPGASPPGYVAEISRAMLLVGLAWTLLGEVILRSIEHGVREGLRSLANGFMEFFDNILILIGNTISYLRIMGIALAHIAIIIAFYQPVAALIGSGGAAAVPAWILYALGNMLDIGLESIVAFAHTLRLHLYEMFGKFYQGVGKPYEPLKQPLIEVVIRGKAEIEMAAVTTIRRSA